MSLRIEAGGTTRTVEVRRRGRGFVVSIDGRDHTVDVSQIDGIWSFLVGTRSHEVTFVDARDGAMMVNVDGQAVPVAMDPARRAWGDRHRGRRASGVDAGAGPHRIVAPMPGKIVRVLVKRGDRVQPRQGLVVVEAMKMENELRSQKAGTVSEVRVAEGSLVEAGTILVIVE